MTDRAPASAPPGLVEWCGVVVLSFCGALCALLEALLVPLYAGSVLVPVTIAAALLSNIALPRLARNLVPRTLAAVLPFAAWLVVIVAFGVFARPEGDVILPGGSIQWVSYAMLLGGALAGTITVVSAAPPPSRATPVKGAKLTR